MDGKERVLIATWGNPFGWRETKYSINRRDVENTKVEGESRSTLPALVDAYQPDRVIIIALDTIANYVGCGEGSKNDCKEIWPSGSDGEFENLTNYEGVIQNVGKRVRWYLKKLSEVTKPDGVSKLLREYLDEGKIEVVVAPGIGDFSSNPKKSGAESGISVRVTVKNGRATDYYHFLMAELARRLPAGDVEIVLDLTHGLNFMPALTYRAVRELSTIGAYFGSIKLTVVNSEPHPKAEGPLNIHVIEETEVAPSPMYLKVGELCWDAFLSSLANGFPLAFVAFYPDETCVLDEIRKITENYQKKTKVRTENRHVIIERPPIDERLSKLSLLYCAVKMGRESKELEGLAEQLPKGELTLEELAAVAKIFEKIPAIGKRVMAEIDNLQRIPTKRGAQISGQWQRRSKIDRSRDSYRRICLSSTDTHCIKLRNFIAHSGLEMNVIDVKFDNNSVFVRYCPDMICIVLKLCEMALSRGLRGDTDV